jgi:MFS family permease
MIISSFLIDRINKLVLIYISPIATILMTALLFFAPNDGLKITVLFVLGVFFSIGLLGLFTYFWKITVPEERGRISGLIGFVALPLNFIVSQLVAPSLDFLGTITLSIIVNLGIIVIVLLKPKKAVLTAKSGEGNYSEKRTVLLYSIPWILFSLINVTLAKNASVSISQQVSSSFYLFLLGMQFVGVIFGCIIGGAMADFFGRRLSLGFSLTSYGTSAALVGIFTSNEALSFVYVVNGLSWGILFTLYIFVVWSDLANKDNCAKMYSIGLTTYYITIGIGLLTQISIPIVFSSLATCLLVFLSNIPIMLAPELLPPYFRERMKMKLHMKAVKKIGKQSKN